MKPLTRILLSASVGSTILAIYTIRQWPVEEPLNTLFVPLNSTVDRLKTIIRLANVEDRVILPEGKWSLNGPLEKKRGVWLIGQGTNIEFYFTNPVVFYKEFK